MKRLLLGITLILCASTGLKAADGDFFPYPKPPEELTNLSDRCDFLVGRFWAGMDFKGALSKMDKFNSTFGDWISFMPYAHADTVHAAIDRVLNRVRKSGPQTLALARMAEAFTYSDTAEIFSEEIYYPFAKAAANHKKISEADRARFKSHVQIMDNTRQGNIVGHLNFITPQNEQKSLDNIHTQMIVLFFNHHDCDECELARVRLSADINATRLIKAGLLTVLSIEPEEASTEWLAAAATYPSDWTVGASGDADEYFDLRTSPSIYILDARHKLLAKDININGLLAAMAALRQNAGI